MLNKIKANKELLLIFIGAFLLRVIGFWNGYPFVFHPDEPTVINTALGLRFNLNPAHFDWPHLHMYLNFILYMVFLKFREVLSLLPFDELLRNTILWKTPLVFYHITRIFNAFLGAASVFPLYLAAKELTGRKAGIITAGIFAVFPLLVRTSHFALIDVPAAFWISWGIYFSYRVFKQVSFKNYALSGAFFGLAASTKYNAIFGTLALVITHLIVARESFRAKQFFLLPGVAILFCLLAFLVGTPFALFDFKTFSRSDSPLGALWQFTNVGSVTFAVQIQQFFTISLKKIAQGTGYTPLIILIVYTFISVRHLIKRQNIKYYLVTVIPAFIIIFNVSGFEKVRDHYFTPAYPFIALAVGVFFVEYVPVKLFKKLLIILFSIPLLLSVMQVVRFVRTDTRVEMYESVQMLAPKGSTIIYNSRDFESPAYKLDRYYTTKRVSQFHEAIKYKGAYYVVMNTDEQFDDQEVLADFSNKLKNGPKGLIYYIND